jgi:DNA-binding response OmpR family regulator
MRILIVEDDPAVRPFLDTYLTIKGFNTLSAPSAEHAEALLLEFPAPPDMVLLDMTLPGLPGLVYAEVLRGRYPEIKVIFMTGWLEGVDVEQAQRRGRLLQKPFYPTDLLEAIHSKIATDP